MFNHAEAIHNAIIIADYFDLSSTVTKTDILIKQGDRLKLITRLLESGHNGFIKLEFWSLDLLPNKEQAFVFPFEIVIGTQKMYQGIYVIGESELLSNKNRKKKDYRITSNIIGRTYKIAFEHNVSKKREERKLEKLESFSKKILRKKGFNDVLFLSN